MLRGSLFALGCLLTAAVVVMAIPAPHAAEPVTVSYRADLAKLSRLAPYPAVAPPAEVSVPEQRTESDSRTGRDRAQ